MKALTLGTVLAERYLVVGPLRREALGRFFLAMDLRTSVVVAVKVYRADEDEPGREAADLPLARARCLREADLLARIDSPHVPLALDITEDAERGALLVCEWRERQSLLDRLKSRGPMPVEELHPLVSQAWQGLCDIHRSDMVHRCLKPANLVLEKDRGGARRVILFDFGLARVGSEGVDGVTLGDFGRALGLFSFMPPEQIGRAKTVDRRADIYALSTVIFQALSGQLPYRARNILALVEAKTKTSARRLSEILGEDVDPRLDTFLARGLERDPASRFQTAEEAHAAWSDLVGPPADRPW